MALPRINPLTQKRIRRFKEIRRSYAALWIMVILYALSLGSEFICNDKPLWVRFEGRTYFPVLKYYPADIFLQNGENTRTDYHALRRMPQFASGSGNYMRFPLFEYGPYLSVNPAELETEQGVDIDLVRQSMVFSINVTPDMTMAATNGVAPFAQRPDHELSGRPLTELLNLPPEMLDALAKRFNNQEAPAFTAELLFNGKPVQASLNAYRYRSGAPKTVRINFRELLTKDMAHSLTLKFDAAGMFKTGDNRRISRDFWQNLSVTEQAALLQLAQKRLTEFTPPLEIKNNEAVYLADARKLQARFPYPPALKHPMGLDNAGRDVLARVLYGLRISMTFGLLLVTATMALGVAAGAVQGYYGGKVDLAGQRFTEIWAALPFLYVMILLGSVYGRGFILLLVCYGLFNWVGISYYMRGEFLRLRTQTFVEAAKCMGLPARKIIFRHILPNGLVPVLTFFPFQLVGAIGALAALDYLGFGLPAPTPSWGEMLSQAQVYRWAWWLILYPGLALFIIMLLGVFVGDGLRNAYDPKRYTWLE